MRKKKLTMYDLAAACGVSIATVSRAINGLKDVRPATRERIFCRMKELGYHPSRTARALSTGQTQVVSVWVGMLRHQLTTTFLAELERHLAEAHYEMLLRDLWQQPFESGALPVAADGIIVIECLAWLDKLLASPRAALIPVVSLGLYWCDAVDHVGIDLTNGVRQAVEHLVETGCRRIGYLVPQKAAVPNNTRYRTYLETMERAGLDPQVMVTPRVSERAEIEHAFEQHLARGIRLDGLLCYNDDHAITAYRVLRRRGLRVPQDVCIIGCNGSQEAEYLECPLSTIVVPAADACAAAWRLLENRMRDPNLPIQSVILEARLAIRASSQPKTHLD